MSKALLQLAAAIMVISPIAASAQSPIYNFVTIAGTTSSANVEGTNCAIRFNNPSGITLDSGGDLYVMDSSNFTIRRLTPVGTNWVSSTHRRIRWRCRQC